MSTEDSLKRNKTKRGTIRSLITKLIKKIDDELVNETADPEIIQDSLAVLLEHKTVLTNIDEIIEQQTETKDLEAEIESSLEYSQSIVFCRSRANRYLNKLNKNLDSNRSNSDTNESSRETISDAKLKSNTKLPRISLSKFSGEICKFQEFWPQYEVAIHENETLQDIEKFNYLKSLLSDSAATAISGLPLTAENYVKAVNILKDRYGKKDVLIAAHTNRLLNLESVRQSNDVNAIRRLYDEISVQIRSLESLGVKPDSYNCLLLPILYKCIPNDLVLQFHRVQNDDKETNVTDLLTYLKKEVEAREKSIYVTNSDFGNTKCIENKYKQNFTAKYSNHFKNKTPSALNLNTVTENHCPFCSEKHKPEDCNLNLEQRKDSLKRQAKCFKCYKPFHRAKQCRSTQTQCSNCKSRGHQKSLCEKPEPIRHSEPQTSPAYDAQVVVSSLIQQQQNKNKDERGDTYVYFQTIRCKLIGRNEIVSVRLLLDSGAQRSFVDQSISRRLGLEVKGQEALRIHTFAGSKNPPVISQNRVRLLLKDNDSDYMFGLEALESENICPDIIGMPNGEVHDQIKKLGIKLSDVNNKLNKEGNKIDILVGGDYYWSIMTGKIKRLSPTLVLNETKFGWALHGRFSNEINSDNIVGAMFVSSLEENEDKSLIELKRFWELESLGISDEPVDIKACDKQTLDDFEKNIKFKNGRYEVKLPMRFDSIELPNNYDVAKGRLEYLVKRFRNNPILFKDYKAVIEEYQSSGIVEIVEPQDVNSSNGNLTYYLPHHPVIRRDKQTTKLRIVFDASAHSPSQLSLNDVLLPGPNLNSDLFDLILQFRSNNIAVVSDIEKAFLQISLTESDSDLTRFLWIKHLPPNADSPLEFVIMKMTRVLFGVTSSPFLLGAVIKHHIKQFEKEYPETCSVINDSMYVDDLLMGASTVEEALKLSQESLDIFLKANMPLRKWNSNSPLLMKNLRTFNFDVCQDTSPSATPLKILGLIWDTEKDVFRIDNHNLSEFVNCQEKTKRTVIRAAGRIFDPVGFLSPFTVIIKIIFQSLWEQGIDWDENLPENLKIKWENWCAQLPHLNKIEIPRYYFRELQGTSDNVEIHCFSDSSEKAFGAVIFLRFVKDNNVKTCFVTSKSRLAPIKHLSLPRLELMGALIGARLINRVLSVLKFKVNNQYLWTDSNIVLHWIKSSSKIWKPFVSNRVVEIQTLTNPRDWYHCPGRDNPADRLTRGLNLTELENDNLWWSGPKWLVKTPQFWPKESQEANERLKLEEAKKGIVQNFCTSGNEEQLIQMDNFSTLLKVIKIVAWIKRFAFNSRNSVKHKGTLSAEEIEEAEEFLIKEVQRKIYKEEIDSLKCGNNVKKSSKICTLYPYLDNTNILRIGSRLNQGDFSPSVINPILLPRDARFTELLVMQEHQKTMHSGVTLTLTKIRKRFWIPQGRQFIKKIIGKCLLCRRYNAKPSNQLTGQLPSDRITESPPFSIIGLDFAGPIMTKIDKINTSKSYIVLFTCATTRAIHLELSTGMTTKSFLLAFRRFLSRRGTCRVIYSDNAKTFKAVDKDLQNFLNIIKEHELHDFIASQGVKWKFIVERAPWWGGFYERMVRSVKEPLRKILGRALLSFEELTTILTEIEAVLNMRPLSYTTSEFGEPEPLTPAHFLHFGRQNFSYPLHFAELENKLSTKENLVRRKVYQTRLIKQLWTKWKEQYLFQLNSAHHFKTAEKHRNLQVGDIVLVNGTSKSKLLWDLGIIVDIIRGRDSLIRACMVKTPKGLFRKPVQLLYPFELDID